MAAIASPSRPRRLRGAGLVALSILPPLAIVVWLVFGPLGGRSRTGVVLAPTPISGPATDGPPPAPAAGLAALWPATPLGGDPAKRLLVDCLAAASDRIERMSGYTATLRRQERLDGELWPEQVQAIKVRHRPFSVYMRYEAPMPGREVVYVEGRNDNKLIAHNNDWTRRLIPRLVLEPTHPIAMARDRHPITEMGIAHALRTLIHFARMDLSDPEATTILDRTSDDDGRTWLRSRHALERPQAGRPFARVEVLYDPETLLPLRIAGYDWPDPGDDPTCLPLAERYAYDDLELDVDLADPHFDPANPEYDFTRF